MRWLLGAAALGIGLGLAWLQFGGAVSTWLRTERAGLERETQASRSVIEGLEADNAKAREEVARLKQQAAVAEARAQAWQVKARAAEAQAAHYQAEVARVSRERQALRRVGSVEEALAELRRLGF